MFKNFKFKKNNYSHIGILAIISTTIFFIAFIFGEGIGSNLGLNQSCSPYLGCASGFFGFDAVEHFIAAVAEVFVLLWIFKKFPKYSLLNDKRWKNILMFIALVALIGVLWEFVECAHDLFRSNILHEVLVNRRLHINLLDQPNNIDTMGDLFFGLLGAIVALFLTKKVDIKN